MSPSQPTRRFDIDQIAPGLYQGSKPAIGYNLRNEGFDVLVLTAREHQPPSELFPDVEVLRVMLDDNGRDFSSGERADAVSMAEKVAARVAAGKKVLVTCYMGWNRSGWVVGHALRLLGADPRRAVDIVKSRRAQALNNKGFARDIANSPSAAASRARIPRAR